MLKRRLLDTENPVKNLTVGRIAPMSPMRSLKRSYSVIFPNFAKRLLAESQTWVDYLFPDLWFSTSFRRVGNIVEDSNVITLPKKVGKYKYVIYNWISFFVNLRIFTKHDLLHSAGVVQGKVIN